MAGDREPTRFPAHRRRLIRLAVLAIAIALGAASYPGAAITGMLVGIRAYEPGPPRPEGDLPWLHVEHPSAGIPYIADPQGRRVLLRGVVVAGLVDYWSGTDPAVLTPPPRQPIDPAAYESGCPPNADDTWIPPLCRDDLHQIRGLGFNVIRLALSWSLLEPRRGLVDQLYLKRIAQVVGWAHQERLYVILDMHQNAFSRHVGRVANPAWGGARAGLNDNDGAPAWATFSDGWPSQKYLGQRELNPAVLASVDNFWLNRSAIQEEYIQSFGALVREFRDDPVVAGFSPFNEPWIGLTLPPQFEDLQLIPFYRRVLDAVTGATDGVPCPGQLPLPICGHADLGVRDRHHLFFLETGLTREITDFPTHLPLPVSSYPNLVMSLHAYTHIYTVDALLGLHGSSWPPYEQSYSWAEREAAATRSALFVSEFGNNPEDDSERLAAQLARQDAHLLGSTFWVWKQNCGGTTWGLYGGVRDTARNRDCAYDRRAAVAAPSAASGCIRPARARLLVRPYPTALGGPAEFVYQPSTGAFMMSLRSAVAATRLRIPALVTGTIAVSGASFAGATEPGGEREIVVEPSSRAEVTISASQPQIPGC